MSPERGLGGTGARDVGMPWALRTAGSRGRVPHLITPQKGRPCLLPQPFFLQPLRILVSRPQTQNKDLPTSHRSLVCRQASADPQLSLPQGQPRKKGRPRRCQTREPPR